MSYKVTKVENNLVRIFLVETRKEIDEQKLPTNNKSGINGLTMDDNTKVAIGSKAICTEDWSRWILNTNNEWVEMKIKSSGSSGSVDDLDIVTQEEIDSIINGLV